jgi:hypothetical protein
LVRLLGMLSNTIYDTIDSIPLDTSSSVRKVNKSINFCIHYVAH